MKIYPTCSLCVNFNPNQSYCQKLHKQCWAMDQEQPIDCTKKGIFLRDMNVLLDSYHLYAIDEKVPTDYRMNFSRLPKDTTGIPLFVYTKRGVERAIPAYSGFNLKGDMLLGVHKSHTFQGQRELIFDLGVECASEIANRRETKLIVLPGEENCIGIESEIKRYLILHRGIK